MPSKTEKTDTTLQSALYHIAQASLEANNLHELCRLVHQILETLLPAKNIYIALYDQATDTLQFPYYVDECDEVTHKERRKTRREMTEYVLRRGEMVLVQRKEYEKLVASGEVTPIGTPPLEWLGLPLRLSDGHIIGVLAVQTYSPGVQYSQHDKSVLQFVSTQIAQTLERKLTTQALEESEEKYRAIVEATHDGIFIYRDLNVLYANERLCELYGAPMQEILTMSPLDFFIPEERPRIAEYTFLRAAGEYAPPCYETTAMRKDGSLITLEMNISKLRFGNQDAFLGVARDISERKLAEKLRDALYQISETVNLCANLDEMYAAVHHIISGFVKADNFFIALYDESTSLLTYPYYIDQYDTPPKPEQFEHGLTEYVIRSGKPLMAPLTLQKALRASGAVRKVGTDSLDWLGIPLRTTDNRILGALVVQSYQEGFTYNQRDKDILLFVSSQVAMAIDRKRAQEQLRYFSSHDGLTGFFNRAYFEKQLQFLQQEPPMQAIIVCDVDGLKLVNDTLGHAAGDDLLRACAKLLKEALPPNATAFRIGGDEFALLLPESSDEQTSLVCRNVYQAMEEYNEVSDSVRLSMSLGYSVRHHSHQTLSDVFKEADNYMYREKLHRSQSTRSSIVNTLMKLLEARDFITEGHGDRMQDMAALLAQTIGMPEKRINDIRLLAQFHDIGKVGIPDYILFKPGPLTPEERIHMQRHAEIGYRIAQSAPDLLPISDWILKHHEHWDGTGYPLGLKGEDIPLACRILSIVDSYDAMTSDRPYRFAMPKEEALKELLRCAGTQFDPLLVEAFLETIG